MSEKEKTAVLEMFKALPKDVQMALIAGKALAEAVEQADKVEGTKYAHTVYCRKEGTQQ